MLCDEVHPQTSETTSTEQALNRLAREIALDIATCLKDMFLWVRSQGKCLSRCWPEWHSRTYPIAARGPLCRPDPPPSNATGSAT
jgi:hypothetical protein